MVEQKFLDLVIETNLQDVDIQVEPSLTQQLKTNQGGSLFYTSDAAVEYASFYFGSIIFFCVVFLIVKVVFPPIASILFKNFYERFQAMDARGKMRRIACVTSNIHHMSIACVVIYVFTDSACENAEPFIWFKSDICMLQVEKKYVDSCLISVGYLTYDLIMQQYVLKFGEYDELAKQMVVHHVLGIVGAFVGLTGGYGLPAVGCLLQLSEVSTIFLNYRSFFDKDEFGNPIPFCLQIFFFIMFTIFRVILMPYAMWRACTVMYYTWAGLVAFRRLCQLFGVGVFIFITLLNYYWYSLIVHRVMVVFGFIKKNEKDGYQKVQFN